MSDQLSIARCEPENRVAALRHLSDGMSEEQKNAFVLALDGVRGEKESVFDGLLVATSEDRLLSSVWVQLMPGKTAVVWPPNENSAASLALMLAAATFLDERNIDLAQILSNPDFPPNLELLSAGGFKQIANLTYLTAEKNFFPQNQPETTLEFVPHAADSPERFGHVILETYKGSLDCPILNGVRDPADIIAGYRTQGTHHPKCWFSIRNAEKDIGVLILASHAEGQNWELVYMGIVPEARGNGFGWQTLQFALWQAKLNHAARMILAVDEANEPALLNYRKAGFVLCDRRTVFARLSN